MLCIKNVRKQTTFAAVMFQLRYFIVLLIVFVQTEAQAQGYVDQANVASIINCQPVTDSLQPVQWHLYRYDDNIDSNGKGRYTEFLDHIDSLPGVYYNYRRYIVELANRTTCDHLNTGDTLLIPDNFPEDYRAYSPYPFNYALADTLPKLFIIDKYTQTFAAYEYGMLVRWGLVSTGNTNTKTPAGRYNFNWKSTFRISNASPPGERWELPFMFNFHINWGLHVHQYSLPIGKAVSHGCVRVAMANAVWNYYWANGTIWGKNTVERNGTPVLVINNNPPKNRAYHWRRTANNQPESLVQLPDDFYTLPAGTKMQEQADWLSGW